MGYSAAEDRLIHAFITRDGGGFDILDDWDALGMRASQSRSTVLDGAHAPADRVMRRLPPGPSLDNYILGIFTTFSLLVASVYAGIADRALTVAVETVQRRMSQASGKAYAQDPNIRWRLASAAIAQDGIWPQIEAACAAIDAGANLGAAWFRQSAGIKVRATETARYVVDEALRCSGGASYFNRSELSRLYRDVLAGIFHPSDDESAHATVAMSLLGPLE
jgi:alkylation response protein AidB-like acyl-CoA dehydrogenase